MKFLVCDDNKRLRTLIKKLLRKYHQIDVLYETSSAEQTLSLLKENPVDIVLMDVLMSGMNGFEACSIIKRQYQYTVVLLVSQLSKEDYLEEIRQSGADDFLSKNELEKLSTYRFTTKSKYDEKL